mmetsp:Transcript_43216/g.143894  ORF Transcript_43216/g.143894 Transcript_43216/m.143894 type:complete len:254 (+) Transcript_43216:101-862(+)
MQLEGEGGEGEDCRERQNPAERGGGEAGSAGALGLAQRGGGDEGESDGRPQGHTQRSQVERQGDGEAEARHRRLELAESRPQAARGLLEIDRRLLGGRARRRRHSRRRREACPPAGAEGLAAPQGVASSGGRRPEDSVRHRPALLRRVATAAVQQHPVEEKNIADGELRSHRQSARIVEAVRAWAELGGPVMPRDGHERDEGVDEARLPSVKVPRLVLSSRERRHTADRVHLADAAEPRRIKHGARHRLGGAG